MRAALKNGSNLTGNLFQIKEKVELFAADEKLKEMKFKPMEKILRGIVYVALIFFRSLHPDV